METLAKLGGLLFDDGDFPSGNNDDSTPRSASEFILGFVAFPEEGPLGQPRPSGWLSATKGATAKPTSTKLSHGS